MRDTAVVSFTEASLLSFSVVTRESATSKAAKVEVPAWVATRDRTEVSRDSGALPAAPKHRSLQLACVVAFQPR